MPVPKEEVIQAVVEALGKNKGFSEKDKNVFARNIVEEVWFSDQLGKEQAQQVENHRKLMSRVKSARRAMELLYEKTGQSIDGIFIDKLAAKKIEERFKIKVSRELFEAYIEIYQRILKTQKPMKRKSGPKNQSASAIANMIAVQYHKQFGVYPAHTKTDNENPKETPYGRVCSVIHKLKISDIEISNHAQGLAVEFVRKNNS